jgi:AraC-like DNA-binding protein
VIIAAFLSPARLTHLRAVAGSEHSLVIARDWRHMADIVRQQACDLMVLDPAAGGHVAHAEIEDLTRRFPSTPTILYASIEPRQMRAVSELAGKGVSAVVLYGFDDGVDRFRRILDRHAGDPVAAALINRLAPSLSRLDAPSADAVRRLFREPHLFRGVEDLAAAAGCSRRTLYRQFTTARLAPPRVFVIAARVLRGYTMLCDPGQTLTDVAAKLAFSSSRAFSERMRELVGVLANGARRRLRQDEMIERLHRSLLVPDSRKAGRMAIH